MHLSFAFLSDRDVRTLLPTARVLLALLPALVAVICAVARPKPNAPPRQAGALDRWRSALAALAFVCLAARSIAGGGAVAALTTAGAAGVCGALANEEAVLGLKEAWPTRVAWLCVALAAGWDLYRSRHHSMDKWLSAAAFTLSSSAALAYALFNADARRTPLTADGYALLTEEQEASPEDRAGPASTGTFAWMSPLLATGYARPLEAQDLFPLIREDDPDAVARRLRSALTKKPTLAKAMTRAFGPHFLVGGVYKLVYDSTQLLVPVLLNRFLKVLGKNDKQAYRIAGLMVVNAIVATLLLHQYFQRTYRTGMRLKSAAISLVFDKALKARRQAEPATDQEKGSDPQQALVTNLMSVDAQRLQDNTTYMFSIVSGIYQIVVTMYLLYGQLGYASFGGLGVMLLMAPVTQRIVLLTRDYQKIVLQYKDKRIKLQTEALGGMKIVKLYGWEDPLGSELKRLREKELTALWHYKLAGVFSRCVFAVVPTVVAVGTFSLYVLTGHELTVSRVYTTLALFNVLRFPLMMVPRAISSAVEALLSVDRIASYLDAPEVSKLPEGDAGDVAVYVENAHIRWPGTSLNTQGAPLLRNVDVSIKKGVLCAVLGETGAGKSGLLTALLGECDVTAGRLGVLGRVAYCAQSAWIQNASVKENILFGSAYDRTKYAETIRRCALKDDLKALADGDRTQIGEKGLTLSGGQKQRVALARAYYAGADVFLLDDCLSTVDAHVAAHLFSELVCHLRDSKKTVVLVTHNLSTIRRCDVVLELSKQTVSYMGSPTDYLKKGSEDPATHPLAALALKHKSQNGSSQSLDQLGKESSEESSEESDVDEEVVTEVTLNTAEHRARGVVKGETRAAYLKATGGLGMVILVITSQLCYQGATVATCWWLGYWSAGAGNAKKIDAKEGLSVYAGLSGAAVLLSVIAYGVASYLGQNAARSLHDQMLDGLLRAPMAFFDRTPLGRLVNLFSKDLYTIDEELPVTLAMWLSVATSCTATVATVAFATPWFLAIITPLGVLYFGTMKYFIPSVRELKRLDATSRSPVFSAFGEALDGATTIRAFRAEGRFSRDQSTKLRTNLKAYFLGTACNRWLAVRLEFLGTLTTGAAAFLAVMGNTAPYKAGLSLTYALSVTQALNWFVRMNADLENNSVAVERVVDQSRVVAEEDGDQVPDAAWPSHGALEVSNLKLRYRPELPLVLKGLTFSVEAGTKLALVGRTGSGKSSFLLALLRLAPPAPGSSISVDGVDVLRCSLACLRRRVSMIPQDPVLFSGDVRFNIDPFHSSSDEDIRRALADAQLEGRTSLDALVEEGGRNFSLGERQLLCLARACLRRSKLLLLDEATSAVDETLDAAVQRAIRCAFDEATVVCIAHRINTIADYDRVLVLDDGAVVEDGVPAVLAQDLASVFGGLSRSHDEGV